MDPWLDRALHEIDDAAHGLTPAQMSWRPAAGKWSVAEILDHLSCTYSSTVAAIARVNAADKPAGTRPCLYQSLAVFAVTSLGYFPSGRQAPPYTLPKGTPADKIVAQIRGNLLQMASVLEESERKFGLTVKLADHPILGPLTVTQWRKFHYRHCHHHVKQLLALRARLPAAVATSA